MRRLTFIIIMLMAMLLFFNSSVFGKIEWIEVANMNEAREFGGSSACVLDGKVYVLSGHKGYGIYYRTSEAYDPELNQWSFIAPMNTIQSGCSAEAVDGKIYIFGGSPTGGTATEIVQEYDPISNNWIYREPLAFNRGNASTTVLNSKIYHVAGVTRGGGGYPYGLIPCLDIYDAFSNTWEYGDDLGISLPEGRYLHKAVTLDGKIYVIGGQREEDPGPTTSVIIFDPATRTWVDGPTLLIARRDHAATVINGKIYVFGGGIDNYNTPIDSIEVYDPETGFWEYEESKLPLPLRNFEAETLNGAIYLIGGNNCDSQGACTLATVFKGTVVTNQPPSIDADQSAINVDEGQPATNSGSLNDPDQDVLTLTASVGTVIDNADGTWSWSFATNDGPAESQTVTITADDGNGGTAELTFDLIVNNVAPTIDTVAVPIDPVLLGTPLYATADFSDPADTNDAPYTCTVNYGDGSGDESGTVDGFTCIGPDHNYAVPGVYIVSVTVTDKDDGSGTAESSEYIVIYDPTGGFVTGGGWINSPGGAYPADPDLTGKANFGFVSKYKRGAKTPTGETEFQFKVADLNFHSDTYEWLVIAGAKAMYKGNGTINGMGNYGFMLSAIDEKLMPSSNADKFRIKIWDKDDGDLVVYDNQMGADENAYPTTAIGGGSIVIHKPK
jgi:N-acetylneuraminic acid mutarotase